MTQSINPAVDREQRLGQFLSRVEALVAQIAAWSDAEGWKVERQSKTLRDKHFGEYQVPRLHIVLPDGELNVEPIGYIGNGEGRVDLEGFPTLSRVKLISGNEWRIVTDSNVPLRLPWNRQTYAQLAHDLLS
jgi:hypothetical protein